MGYMVSIRTIDELYRCKKSWSVDPRNNRYSDKNSKTVVVDRSTYVSAESSFDLQTYFASWEYNYRHFSIFSSLYEFDHTSIVWPRGYMLNTKSVFTYNHPIHDQDFKDRRKHPSPWWTPLIHCRQYVDITRSGLLAGPQIWTRFKF